MSVHSLIVRLLLFLITVKQMEIPDTCHVCVLCQESLQNETSTVQLGLKGSAGINNASTKRGDTILIVPGQYIHTECRRNYCNPNIIELSSVEHNNDYLPESLRLLLRTVFIEKNADVKIASVGQAIIQEARPRVIIAPLQIGLGVQLHHQFASQFLIDTLNKLGFCASYTEVQKFELCAAVSQGTDIPGFIPGSCIQYVADNVDHNIRTLDGHGTFHGMGVIACVTPATRRHLPIKRMDVTKEDILAAGDIFVYCTGRKKMKRRNN